MAFDAHANFAYSGVAVAPAPALTGLSLEVQAGTGVLFPAPPFNCTVWATNSGPVSTNAEIIRVTAVVGDVFTIVRAQESTAARAILFGDQIANTITAKSLKDLEVVASTSGAGSPEGVVAASPGAMYLDTSIDPPSLWAKLSGTGNVGWRQLIA
jgi:hypothetical protein